MSTAHAFTSGDETDYEMETLVTGDEDPLVTEICSWFWDRKPKAKDRGASQAKCGQIEERLRELRDLRHIGPNKNYPEYYDVWGTVFKWLSDDCTVPPQLSNALIGLEKNILRKKDLYYKKNGERTKDIKVISPYDYKYVVSLKHATIEDSAIERRFNVDQYDNKDKMVSLRLSDEERNALKARPITLCVPDVPVWFKATETFLEAIQDVYNFFYGLGHKLRKDVEPFLETRRKTTTAQSKPAATPRLSPHQLWVQERIQERALAKSKTSKPEPEPEPEPESQLPKELKVGDLYGGGDNKRYWVRINAIENDIVHYSDPNWKCSIKSVLLRNDSVMRIWDFKRIYEWKCTPEIKEAKPAPLRPKPDRVMRVWDWKLSQKREKKLSQRPQNHKAEEENLVTDGRLIFAVKKVLHEKKEFYEFTPKWDDVDDNDICLVNYVENGKIGKPSFKVDKKDISEEFWGRFQDTTMSASCPNWNYENEEYLVETYEKYDKEIETKFDLDYDELRNYMEKYGGTKDDDKIAYGFFCKYLKEELYHNWTRDEILRYIDDIGDWAPFETWSKRKLAIAAKKHASDIKNVLKPISTPALPPATLANESALPPATLANESPPATLANESPPATPPALVPASAPASPTSSLTSSRSTVSPQSAMGTVDKWGGFRAIPRGTAATQPSSNMEVEVVDLTNDTDEDFDQFKLSDDSSGSDTDDATDDEAPFGWPTSDMLAKAKKTRIEVKDRGASLNGTQVSTSQSDGYRLILNVLNTWYKKGGPTNLIDLGSGNGMLLAVSAMIRDLFQCKDFNVYGIEQCPMAVEASKKLLKGLQLSANVKCENLFYLKSLRKGITHVFCQSNGFNPALQFQTWELLSQQRDTIKVVAMGVGLANKEAAMYDFFYIKKEGVTEKRKLRSNVVPFTPLSSKTQTIHIIDTSNPSFWDDLNQFLKDAKAENGDGKLSFARKAYEKLRDIKKKRPRSHSDDGSRKRTKYSPVNVAIWNRTGGTFTD